VAQLESSEPALREETMDICSLDQVFADNSLPKFFRMRDRSYSPFGDSLAPVTAAPSFWKAPVLPMIFNSSSTVHVLGVSLLLKGSFSFNV